MNKFTFLVLILSIISTGIGAQSLPNESSTFKHLSMEDGLSDPSVAAFYQDIHGLMWIGTRNGLNRYDGAKISIFGKEQGLVNSNILDIKGSHGDSLLWIATRGGLALFDTHKQEFTEHLAVDSIRSSVIQIFVFSDDDIWFATLEGVYHLDHGMLEKYTHDPSDPFSLDDNIILTVCPIEDKVYVGSIEGLNIIDKSSKRIFNAGNSDDAIFSRCNGMISRILKTSKGELWMGMYTEEKGSWVLRIKQNGDIQDYFSSENDPRALIFNYSVLSLMEDRYGRIWVGSNGGGLSLFDEATDGFTNIIHDPKHASGLNDIDVWDIYEDDTGVIWVGTDGGGVNLYHPAYDRFKVVKNNPFDEGSINSNQILSIEEDERYVWLGTNASTGLSRFDRQTGEFYNYPYDNESTSLLDNTVYALLSLDSYLWVGSHSGGLSRLDIETNTFKHFYSYQSDELLESDLNYIRSMVHHDSLLFMGTAAGLSSLNLITNQRINYHLDLGIKERQVNHIKKVNDILWIASKTGLEWFDLREREFIDLEGFPRITQEITCVLNRGTTTWLGTYDGLIRIENGSTIEVTTADGLSDNSIQGLALDGNDRIWVSTKKGLNLMNTVNGSLSSFAKSDGLPSDNFNYGAIHVGENDRMYTGTNEGYAYFDPTEINVQKEVLSPVLDRISVLSGDHEVVMDLKGVDQIELDYDESTFLIDFFSADYILPAKNQFKYRLLGLSDRFFDLGSNSELTITDLNSGVYTLEIYGTNSDGLWTEEPTVVTIAIAPPFWLAWYAWFVYVLAIVGLFFARDQYQKSKNRKLEKIILSRTEELRLQKDKAEKDGALIAEQSNKLQELDKVKTNFFSNISHEFRTPLTLIQAPIDMILYGKKAPPSDVAANLKIAERNVDALSTLIDELLEFNKLDIGGLDINYVPVHVSDYFHNLQLGYKTLAQSNDLNWEYECDVEEDVFVSLPVDKVEKITNNLVSNAIKHTPLGAKVALTVGYKGGQLKIVVQDEGGGIDEEELPKIFERFYQSTYGKQMPHSSGVGLAYVKEITEALDGKISVDSSLGDGTTFYFSIAAQRAKQDELINNEKDVPKESAVLPLDQLRLTNNKVLIVEDNPDMAEYVGHVLGERFEIQYAENGKSGLEALANFHADLVITDLMMPVMDGIEFITHIKANPDWRYTSVIVLTAKSGFDVRIEALALGLDDYLTKPFSPLELEVRIINLLKNQAERQSWRSSNDAATSEGPLIHTLKDYISANLNNSQLGVLNLSEVVSISERQLTRLVKKSIGLTPANLIREIRLAEARQLLEGRLYRSVSEVSRVVGFEKPSYFSKVYFERFGKKPSTYLV